MIQTYRTPNDADKDKAAMRGWQAYIKRMYIPEDTNANKRGWVYVIQCDGTKHLHTDGYVR